MRVLHAGPMVGRQHVALVNGSLAYGGSVLLTVAADTPCNGATTRWTHPHPLVFNYHLARNTAREHCNCATELNAWVGQSTRDMELALRVAKGRDRDVNLGIINECIRMLPIPHSACVTSTKTRQESGRVEVVARTRYPG